MTSWRAGTLLIATAAALAAPGSPRAQVQPRSTEQTAQDRLAFQAYQAQLHEQLAADEASPGGATPGAAPNAGAGPRAGCKLFQGDAYRVPAQECMGCHGMHSTHPVELDYEASRAKDRAALRPAQEVVARGVFLPEGQVRCVTCHEASSRWAAHLALPPGALVKPPVDHRRRETYERPAKPVAPELMPQGSAVSPTPLCKACHTLGD